MSNFTSILRKGMLLTALVFAFAGASAATIDYEGITYTVGTGTKATQLTVAKPSKEIGSYSGDIKLPDNPVTINGKEYTIVGVAAAAFKNNTTVTSLYMPDGCITIPRGAFQGMTALKTVRMPEDIVKINADWFNGCSSLEEFTFPASMTTLGGNMFKNCTSLKKLVFAPSETEFTWNINTALILKDQKDASGNITAYASPLEEVEIHRNIGGYTQPAEVPFRGSNLKKVVIGDEVTSLGAYYFENCTSLTDLTIGKGVKTIGSNCFANTGIASVVLPDGVTSIQGSTFQNCSNLKSVTLGNAVTSIAEMAFYNSPVEIINWPATLASISSYAFSGAKFTGALALPEGVTYIGVQAFAKNNVSELQLPASLATIGDAAFMLCSNVEKITVAEGNEAYKVENEALVTKDGETIVFFPLNSATTSYSNGTAKKIIAHAFHGAKNLTVIDLPNVTEYGNYALAATSVTKQNLKGNIGRYVLQNCQSLVESTLLDGKEIPYGVFDGCTSLEKFTCASEPTIVKQEAFRGTTKLKALDLGSILAILEADAFKNSGLESITVRATYPAAMAEGVFTSDMSGITVNVPLSLVDTYKEAAGWKLLTIAGDANLAAGGEKMGMPNGLYYASQDGLLKCSYADGNTDEYNVGDVPHTFQLIQFKNRIYGSSAGQKFTYSGSSGVEGDGKLFYISQINNNIFQAVVLDNAGQNAYKDPFNLYIYGDTLFVNDRNVCIRKIAADAIALSPNYPSWVENNWLGYYGNPWAYGCIKCGFAITEDKDAEGKAEPLYWLGLKYNGQGIFRFKEKDINSGVKPEYGEILSNLSPIFTTFNLDTKNGYFYIYIEKAGRSADATVASVSGPEEDGTLIKGGLYRAKLEDVLANPNPDYAGFKSMYTLVDGSPVRYEGSATNEHVGISQLSIDENNEYMYWCYRAATEADVNNSNELTTQQGGHYVWAEAFDESNPLHKSGIKRIKLDDPEAKVEMVVPGVEGYGVVAVNYEGSTKPEGGIKNISADKTAADRIIVSGDSFTLTEDATVTIYSMNGSVVANEKVAADNNNTLRGNASGVYVIEARFTDGAKQNVKVIVK
ncbi:MAG: leucine-rich repeat domain-containing protein [Bacteroidales bacterium]|nr:leucine-rich repeat domain-containing protein [Bacteroidales bacterium]